MTICMTLTCVGVIVTALVDDPSVEEVPGQIEITLTPTVEATIQATSQPTSTSEPTVGPLPTATLEPTLTPSPTVPPIDPTPTYTPWPTQTPRPLPTPTPTPLPYTPPFEHYLYDDGLSIAISEWTEIVFRVGSIYSPPSGSRYIYFDTISCANGSREVSVNPLDFQLELPDSRRVNTTFVMGVDDSGDLRASRISPGECVRGFINFRIPADVDPVYLLYDSMLRNQIKFLAVMVDESGV